MKKVRLAFRGTIYNNPEAEWWRINSIKNM
jgi:hypothetical protein